MGMCALAAMADDPDQGGRYKQPSDTASDFVAFPLNGDRHWQAHAMGAVNRCCINMHDVGNSQPTATDLTGIHWVIVGGESGTRARGEGRFRNQGACNSR
jgi:hypothetical protein